MKRIQSFLLRHRFLLSICALAATVFLVNYLLNPQRPYAVAPQGYYGHTDVRQHYLQAMELRDTGTMITYMYGPLYGMLGSFFFAIYPTDIFLFPDLALFIATIAGLYLVSRRLFGEYPALLTAIAVTTTVTVHKLFVFPWATSVSTCCTVWMFYTVLRLYDERDAARRFWLFVAGAFLAACAYYARFSVEFILASLPLGVYLFWQVITTKDIRKFLAESALFIGITTLFLAPLLYDHTLRFDHPFKTQYSFILNEEGIPYQSLGILKPNQTFSSLGEAIFGIGYIDEQYRPVIYESPILLLELVALLLTIIFWRRYSGLQQMTMIAILAVITLNLLFYGMYPAFSGIHVKFGCVHYIRLSLVLIGIFLGSSVWVYSSGSSSVSAKHRDEPPSLRG